MSGVVSIMDFVPIPPHLYQIKMYKSTLLFRTTNMISSLRLSLGLLLGKDQVHIFKRKIFLKEKYQSQRTFYQN